MEGVQLGRRGLHVRREEDSDGELEASSDGMTLGSRLARHHTTGGATAELDVQTLARTRPPAQLETRSATSLQAPTPTDSLVVLEAKLIQKARRLVPRTSSSAFLLPLSFPRRRSVELLAGRTMLLSCLTVRRRLLTL
jgi:hypothetical protein